MKNFVSRTILSTLALLVWVQVSPAAPAENKANALIAQWKRKVASVKTYQAEVKMVDEQSSISGISPQSRIVFVLDRQHKRFRHSLRSASSQDLTPLNKLGFEMFDDGRWVYEYFRSPKLYLKNPHTKNRLYQHVAKNLYQPVPTGPCKYVGMARLNGRLMYVLKQKHQVPANEKAHTVFYMDAKTHLLVKSVRTDVTYKKGRIYSRQFITIIKNEIIDAEIPASVFKFTPPKGSKQNTNRS